MWLCNRRFILLNLISLIRPFQLEAAIVFLLLLTVLLTVDLCLATLVLFGTVKSVFVLFVPLLPPCWSNCWRWAVVTVVGHGETPCCGCSWFSSPSVFKGRLVSRPREMSPSHRAGQPSQMSTPEQVSAEHPTRCGCVTGFP